MRNIITTCQVELLPCRLPPLRCTVAVLLCAAAGPARCCCCCRAHPCLRANGVLPGGVCCQVGGQEAQRGSGGLVAWQWWRQGGRGECAGPQQCRDACASKQLRMRLNMTANQHFGSWLACWLPSQQCPGHPSLLGAACAAGLMLGLAAHHRQAWQDCLQLHPSLPGCCWAGMRPPPPHLPP